MTIEIKIKSIGPNGIPGSDHITTLSPEGALNGRTPGEKYTQSDKGQVVKVSTSVRDIAGNVHDIEETLHRHPKTGVLTREATRLINGQKADFSEEPFIAANEQGTQLISTRFRGH